MSTESAIRASDADRERVIAVLRDGYAAGRLTLAEFDERTTAAFAARTWGELRGLTNDLPSPPGPPPAPDGLAEGARARGWDAGAGHRMLPVLPIVMIWFAVTLAAHVPGAFIPIAIVLVVALRSTCRGRSEPGFGDRCPPGRDPSGRGGPA